MTIAPSRVLPVKWTQWVSIVKFDHQNTPKKTGVYELRYASKGKAIPLARVFGTDQRGLLYVGSTHRRTLRKRLKEFKEAVAENRHARCTARKTYWDYKFYDAFPCEKLELRYAPCKDAEGEETKILQEYLMKFKDKPPMNFTFSRRLVGK
jgi:hypothetical protein